MSVAKTSGGPFMRMLRRVIDGVQIGLMFAAAYAVIAIVLFVLSKGAALDHSFSVLGRVIAVYVAAGIVGGAIFGLLQPIVQWAIGAAVLGTIVAIPAYVGMRIAVHGLAAWTRGDTSDVLVLSLLLGSIGGVGLRHRLIKRGLWTPSKP